LHHDLVPVDEANICTNVTLLKRQTKYISPNIRRFLAPIRRQKGDINGRTIRAKVTLVIASHIRQKQSARVPSERRAEASGKQIRFPHTLYYGDREVALLLKNRERYLSFHAVSELETLNAKSLVIYEREGSGLSPST
jgi:hypothetical protein